MKDQADCTSLLSSSSSVSSKANTAKTLALNGNERVVIDTGSDFVAGERYNPIVGICIYDVFRDMLLTTLSCSSVYPFATAFRSSRRLVEERLRGGKGCDW